MSRLADAQSAYLRSAAHQPVDWYPWSAEAFERAKTANKPVLLDIGAVWCHWCHVMDGESYENADLAAILNRDWICIKVDRDERPDVDARYQRAVQALTQQGGWPLTAFLTPAGDVFYGGTYFPPDDRHGRPAFAKVLTELARMFREQPDRIATQAREIREHVTATLSESNPGAVDAGILDRAADGIAQFFDARNGGFGSQPKFPHPATCEFLLARWFDTRERWPKEIVDRTLVSMARGGIYDQVGGGFHRYSVDARWIVPHFEKMSYDNSELLRAYVSGAAAEGAGDAGTDYRRVIDGTVAWIRDVMTDPAGGYYSSQDADVGLDDDGDYFTWTADEARAAVTGDEFDVLTRHYDIEEAGEMHHNPGKNVLWVSEPVDAIAKSLGIDESQVVKRLASGRAKLAAARSKREAPFVDRTLYTGWNAMMISAILATMSDDANALRGLERIFRDASVDDGAGGVRHAIGSGIGGILEDQVHVANAALDAWEVTGERAWLGRAERLAEHAWSSFGTDDGSLTDTARGQGGEGFLDQVIKPIQDAPTPSPNGVAGIVASRLAEHTGSDEWRARAERLLSAFAGGAVQLAIHGATLLRAIDWHVNPAAHVVIAGNLDDPAVAALHRTARATYRPRKVLTLLAPGTVAASLPAPLRAMLNGVTPRGYVCAGPQCGPPATTPEQLADILTTLGRGRA